MPTSYEKNKKHIYKWMANNNDKKRKINLKYIHFKRECIRMRNILIEIN
jgi:hypothetical protein